MDAQTRMEIQNLTDRQQQYVIQTLPAKEKAVSTAYICWIVLGVHYFYLNKPLKNVILWLLSGIFIGVIWWVYDAFRMKRLVAECNRNIAKKVIEDAIALYPKAAENSKSEASLS